MKGFYYRIFLSLLTLTVLSRCSTNQVETENSVVAVPTDSLQQAISALNAEIFANPDKDRLYRQRSELYTQFGSNDAAYKDALSAVGLDSSNAENWLTMGKAAFGVENYYRVEDAYLKCIEFAPKNSECHTKLAEFYLLRKKYTEALKYANDALRIDQNQARPYFIKGWVFMEKGDTIKAVSSYQTAVELDPNFYDGFMILGSMYAVVKNDIALDYYNSALAVRPKSIEARYSIGMYYQNKGRVDDAFASYDSIISLDSTYSRAYFNKAFIKMTLLKFDEAIPLYDRALRFNPQYYEAYYNRGFCREQLGETSKAVTDYKLSLGVNPLYELAVEGIRRTQK